jgi:periplasmic protein TonB
MQRPDHNVLRSGAATTSTGRFAGFLIAGAVNIAFVYGLTSGFVTRIVRDIPHAMEVSVITTPDKPQPATEPPKPQIAQPDNMATVAPPDIQIQTDTPRPIIAATSAPTTPAADSAASAVGSTHSIPPYPAEAKRLGQEGTVLLRLTISASGDVMSAEIVQSSGFAELDQTAAAWVQAHWKYKPAVQGGIAVESTTTAAVKFDLKKA